MADEANPTPARNKVAGTRMTEEEYRRVQVVAGLHSTTVSKLLRKMSVEDALAEYEDRAPVASDSDAA